MLLSLLFPLLATAKVVDKDPLLLVDDVGLADTIATNHTLLVQFSAGWCGQCKKFSADFEKTATRLKKEGIRTALIDGSMHPHFTTAYGVLGYPSLFLVIDSKPIEYKGPRTAVELTKWALSKSAPQAKLVSSPTDIEALVKTNSPVTVLFAEQNSTEIDLFERVSRSLNGTFVRTEDSATAEHYGVKMPAVIVLKKNEEKRKDFAGEMTESILKEFIVHSTLPWKLAFSAKTSHQIFYPNSTRLFLFRKEADIEHFKDLTEELRTHLQGNPLLVTADLTSDLNNRLAELLGVNPDAQPFMLLYQAQGAQVFKYIYSGEKKLEGIQAFLDQHRKGDLTAYYKSEEPPKETHDKGVRVLVGRTFKEVVLDTDKAVLVAFYAPWCGHWYRLSSEYERVAEHFKSRSDIVVAKIDAMANEVEGQGLETYPVIKLFRKGDRKGVVFQGERKAADLVEFVEAQLGGR